MAKHIQILLLLIFSPIVSANGLSSPKNQSVEKAEKVIIKCKQSVQPETGSNTWKQEMNKCLKRLSTQKN